MNRPPEALQGYRTSRKRRWEQEPGPVRAARPVPRARLPTEARTRPLTYPRVPADYLACPLTPRYGQPEPTRENGARYAVSGTTASTRRGDASSTR